MKAVTVGSAVVDIITIVADSDIERMTMQNVASSFLLLEQGRKIDAESISTHLGGGAVNAAVAMARLGGLEISALIKIGMDLNGDRILERFAEEGIGASLICRTAEAGTGVAVMVSSHDRNATIFTHRGANTLLQEKDIQKTAFDDLDLLYVTSLSDSSADRFPLLVERAHQAGAMVAVNPGIRQLTSRTESFLKSLAKIDILIMNKVEVAALVPALSALAPAVLSEVRPGDGAPLPDLMRKGLSFGGFDRSLVNVMMQLRGFGPSYVVITDGINGAYVASEESLLFCPALATEVQGTAGAGDAFASTLSSLLAGGEPCEAAVRAGVINAASVVGQVDTQSGLLAKAEIDTRIEALEARLPLRRFPLSP